MRRSIVGLFGACVIVGSVVAVAAYVRPGHSPRRVVIASASPTTELWDVPVSRASAIAAVKKLTSEVDPSSTETAKLMTYGELSAATPSDSTTYGTSASQQIWAVLALGKYTPAFGRGEFPWGILLVDAQDGSVTGAIASMHDPTPPYWDSLPDHGPTS